MMSSTAPLQKLVYVRDEIAKVCPVRVILDCDILEENEAAFKKFGESLKNFDSLYRGPSFSHRSATSLSALSAHTEFRVVVRETHNIDQCLEVIERMKSIGLNMVEDYDFEEEDAITRICAEKDTMQSRLLIPERTFVVRAACSNPRVNLITSERLIADMRTLKNINEDIIRRYERNAALSDFPPPDVLDKSPEAAKRKRDKAA